MAKSPQKPEQPPSFEQALEQLERIVSDLEEGELGLSASLTRYEQGVQLLRQCHALLEQAEHKIEQLSRVDARGEAVSEPLDDTASLPDEALQSPPQSGETGREVTQASQAADGGDRRGRAAGPVLEWQKCCRPR